MDNKRFCIFCDQEVKEPTPGDRVFGRGEIPKGFVHVKPSQEGVPNCRRQSLDEGETYTMGYSASRPADEY